MYPLIVLHGRANCGKSTFVEAAQKTGTLIEEISLAGPIKEFVNRYFAVSQECLYGPSLLRNGPVEFKQTKKDLLKDFKASGFEYLKYNLRVEGTQLNELYQSFINYFEAEMPDNVSVRKLLQNLGTEVGRVISPNLWLEVAKFRIDESLSLRSSDLVIVPDARFRNEVLSFKKEGAFLVKINRDSVIKDEHESESHILPDFWFDVVIDNNSTLASYKLIVEKIVKYVLQRPKTLAADLVMHAAVDGPVTWPAKPL